MKKFQADSSLGPRMAKAVNEAWGKVTWEGKTYVELSEIAGGPEHSGVLTEPFGTIRPDATAGLAAIGDRFEWTLTAENYKRVVFELDTLKRRLEESRPVRDNRRTQAEEAARIDEQKAREQDRKIEASLHSAEYQKALADLKARYPWAKQEGSSHARASANIKRELSQAFPGIAFSVRSDSFSGGDSVDVHWENGPTTKEVEAITSKYQEGSFDGMQDLYEYDHSPMAKAVSTWLGSAKYVQESRGFSDSIELLTARLLCDAQKIPFVEPHDGKTHHLRNVRGLYGAGDGEDLLTHTYRLLQNVSFPSLFEVIGIRDDDVSGHPEPYTLDLRSPQAETKTAGGARAEIQKHHHTKHDFDFWLVVMADRLGSDQFSALRTKCESAGGWYSRKWGRCPGGFAFKEEAKAIAFLESIG
jgi:hypothetical protein